MIAAITQEIQMKRIEIDSLKDILATFKKIEEIKKEIAIRRKAHPNLKGLPKDHNETAILRAEENLKNYLYLVKDV